MNIALIAHDQKKELMISFCIAYKSILQKHNLFATGTTGSIINKTVGLNVYRLSPGTLGEQQIAARAAYNELDMVICFRDNLHVQEHEHEVSTLFRHCDTNNIPFATNIATAEMLIHGLERGDLAWREYVNTSEKPKTP